MRIRRFEQEQKTGAQGAKTGSGFRVSTIEFLSSVRALAGRGVLLLGLLAAALAAGASPALAQTDEALTPEQSSAKGRQLIQQTVQAMGGPAYLGVRDVTCVGRVGFFGHNGDLNGYDKIWDYILEPDKERTEYSSKHNIIDVYNGNQGWTLDKGGVSEATADAVADFQSGLKRDINYLFRYRLNEPGMIFRYDGPDVVDLKESDWVEVVDANAQTIRIALDRSSHLPLRVVYVTRDPITRDKSEETEFFSNYQPIQGIQTPFQDSRIRDGQKIFQAFYEQCQYNTGLDPGLFTRQSLEERWSKIGKKHKKK